MLPGDLLRRLGVDHVVDVADAVEPRGRTGQGRGGARRIPGIPRFEAPDRACAMLLAEAAGTMGSGVGAVWDGDVLTLLSRAPGAGAAADGSPAPIPTEGAGAEGGPAGDVVTVASARELAAVVEQARRAGSGAVAIRPDFDLAAALPGQPAGDRPAAGLADPSLAPRLTALPGRDEGTGSAAVPDGAHTDRDGNLLVDLVLVGRGVIRAGGVPALRAFAERTGLGVLNTFTAKGLFRWDSPFHLGTGCLQLHDLALAGVHPDAVVVAIGVDADECPPALFEDAGFDPARLVSLDVSDLDGGEGGPRQDLVSRLRARRPVDQAERPRLYRDLAAVAQPLYTRHAAPLNPARAAADVAEVLPEGAAVWAEPGLAGMWLARALPTTRLGSARVPAAGSPGVAVAGALSAALRPGGVGVAIVDQPPRDGVAAALLDWAATAPGTLVVEVWGEDGEPRDSAGHQARLAAALAEPGVHVIEVPVDYTMTKALVEVSGPVVAWGGRVAVPSAAAATPTPRQ